MPPMDVQDFSEENDMKTEKFKVCELVGLTVTTAIFILNKLALQTSTTCNHFSIL